jgi:prostaglandin-H2 D-isomerase / glutathione transferase
MPTYKYTYFNLRGRGETVRLCFAAAGIKFEDKRVEFKDWPAIKDSTPWGSLPVLEVDGRSLGQSMTIAKYVAREAGLHGKTSMEQALIDSVVDTVTDLREKMIEAHFKPEDLKAAAQKDFQEKTIPASLTALEKFAATNKEKPGFFVGSKITLADIHFFSIVEILMSSAPTILSTFPTLKKVNDNVAANPKIAEYIKKRPQTAF